MVVVVPANQLVHNSNIGMSLTGERPLSPTASTRPMASEDLPSRSSSSTSSPISPVLKAQIVLPSLCSKVLSVGVEQKRTFVADFSFSAGETVSIPLTVTSEVIVRAPVLGAGIGSERRGRRVGPRWMFIVGDGSVAEVEGTVGITE